MIYKVGNIAKDVRVAIDENLSGTQLLTDGDIDTLTLEDIVRSKILEAVRRVEISAPMYYLEEGHSFGDAIFWMEKGSGWVLLPDDFMRLIMFRMTDWERTLYSAIAPEDAEYSRQSSRYRGIRGNPQKPVCAIVPRPEGKALEFYSCKDETAQVARATYLPYPKIDKDDGIDICERCYTAVVYMAASLVLTTFGESDKATVMTELSRSYLE